MKSILIIALTLLAPIIINAQEYSEVVQTPGKTPKQLYSTARMWFAENFKSANSVLQMDDADAGILVGKGNLVITEHISPVVGSYKWVVHFSMKVMIRDGRYKCDISDIFIESGLNEEPVGNKTPYSDYLNGKDIFYKNSQKKGTTGKGSMAIYNLINQVEVEISRTMASLKKSMTSQAEEEDW